MGVLDRNSIMWGTTENIQLWFTLNKKYGDGGTSLKFQLRLKGRSSII